MRETTGPAASGDAAPNEWVIDDLARLVGLPVRTIREYQTLGVLHPPRREGRVGLYGAGHLRRLQLIARLRDRGYSLAGIGDLLGSWSSGSDLGDVLGLEPDELVHVDEPGAAATLDQLRAALPTLIPDHLDALEASGVIERYGPGSYCIPSPSLVQLAIEATSAGLDADGVMALLQSIQQAADTVVDQVAQQIAALASGTEPKATAAFLLRGRGLLGHGVGRLTLHRIGRRLGIDDDSELFPAVGDLVDRRGDTQ
jgi:DNA-binding transcriptional MerR regulator